MLNKEQNDEECDATDDAMKNCSWHQKIFINCPFGKI
jgi:hypothetical protein